MISWILIWWRRWFPSVETIPTDPQGVFDFVVKKLREQGRASANRRRCLYRGPHGMKCAVGQMIPDDLYDPKMDDDGDTCSGLRHILPKIGQMDNYELLAALQLAHDKCWTVSGASHADFCAELSCIAERFGLNDKVVRRWEASL